MSNVALLGMTVNMEDPSTPLGMTHPLGMKEFFLKKENRMREFLSDIIRKNMLSYF